MARGSAEVQNAIPTPEGWQRNLLIGLFVAYVLELLLFNAGVDVYGWLAWHSFGVGFEPWGPISRFLVQGAGQGAVINVLIGLFVLFFTLPIMSTITDRNTLATAVVAGALGGTALPLVLDLTTTMASPFVLMGWHNLVLVPFVLMGIARPNATVYLVVFPVLARWILWGTLVLALLYILADPSASSFEMLGVWLGTYAWWQFLGPGRRRRDLVKKAGRIEKELRRFQVLEGGAQGSQGDDDDLVN